MSFPVIITDLALQMLIEAMVENNLDDTFAVRVFSRPGGCAGFKNELDFDNEIADDDLVEIFENNANNAKVKAVIDPQSAQYMKAVVLDYVVSDWEEGFFFQGGDLVEKSCACGASVSYCKLEE